MKCEVKIERTVIEVYHFLVDGEDDADARIAASDSVLFVSPTYTINISTEIVDAQPRED